jgi:hypothetical protein
LSVIEVAPRDDIVTKRLQAIDGVAVDAKGKGEATQIADEEI